MLLLLMGAQIPIRAQSDLTALTADLEQLTDWFAGEFNNYQQVWKEREDSVAQELRHEHIHSIFKRVEAPKLGKHVFFVKQYQNADTSDIYRQRVYRFTPNPAEDAIQLDIFSFKTPEDEERYRLANHQATLLRDLGPDDFRSLPGCAVYWRRDDDGFIGYMHDRACHFTSRRSGKEIYITDSLRLTQDELWIRDEAYDADGNYVFGHKGGVHHKLKRVRYFDGWMAVQKPDSEEYYVMRAIRLHDQGQRVRLVDVDGTVTPYAVELSEVIYRSGIEILKLAIYEDGKDRAVAYVWTNPEAERIGINMRSITAGFTLRPAELK